MIHPVRVLAITGGKGGVGKSNVAVNLGVVLARRGRRTVLMDADLGLANVDVLLGIKPRCTLEDVLAGRASVLDTLVTGPAGLRIVPAASGAREMLDLSLRQHAALIQAFSVLDNQTDVLIIDTAAGISDAVTHYLHAAQEVVIVVTDEPTSITDAYALIKVMSQHHQVSRFRIVANMVRSEREGERLFQKLLTVAGRFLDVTLDLAASLPYDDSVRRAVRRQRAVCDVYPSSDVARAFERLADAVERWPLPRGSRGHLEFFMERLMGRGASAA